ncbi:MAG: DUF5615 family PIN-like protein [Chloroflexi bacterium]|nr:DUF5615 family PIN-like protein [Chloroflexota bacterium]
MKEVSTKHSQKSLPRLERLLVDTDVKATIVPYLRAVGFRVLLATKVDVDVRQDVAVIRWAKQHNRIVVTHDKYKDRKTKIKVCQEIYEHGGHAIQIGGDGNQHPLTSLAKILLYRKDWLKFFQDNDGMVLVHQTGMKKFPRVYLIRQIQAQFDHDLIPPIVPKVTRKTRERKPKPTSPSQPPLISD